MNKKHLYKVFSLILFSTTLVACNSYLDENPDNRAELDSDTKITQLLVSAYPTTNYALLTEMSSDNTDENAGTYTPINLLQTQAATWQDITEKEEDSPYNLWNDCYKSIAASNEVLTAIAKQGNPTRLSAQRGEALMCRAYNHFILANVFCKAYSPKTSNTDLGIPYMTQPETTVSPKYSRGTVADDYKAMAEDIEAGLPLINDQIYSIPKYHFNKKAAYAFAVRFYLYYVQDDKSNYDKVIKYAENVLTSNASGMLRDWKTVGALSPNNSVRANAFISVDEKANLLILSTRSLWARVYGPYGLGERYTHGTTIATTETNKTTAPWGTYNALYFKIYQYQGLPKVIMDKMAENFEYTDPVNGIGYAHVMFPALTTDEVLLNRAEAYAMKGEYEKAITDLNTFMHAFTNTTRTITAESLASMYGEYDATAKTGMKYYAPTAPTPKKKLNPDFAVAAGEQENIVQCILYMRRICNLHEGLRWFDVKRYGIKIYRRTITTSNAIEVKDSMEVNDPRRALQLPQSVITAGLEPNPRNK